MVKLEFYLINLPVNRKKKKHLKIGAFEFVPALLVNIFVYYEFNHHLGNH